MTIKRNKKGVLEVLGHKTPCTALIMRRWQRGVGKEETGEEVIEGIR